MDAVAIVAIAVSGAVGVTGACAPVLSSLSERHGKERRRIIEHRADAYLSLVVLFTAPDRDRSAMPLVDAKMSLYASRSMRDLYREWRDTTDASSLRRMEDDFRDQAAREIQ